MSNDEKIVSLDERRGMRKEKEAHRENSPQATSGSGSGGSERPVKGRLIWLFCPTCNTLEYTEMPMGGGRVHNTCGTQVTEAEVELDLRAETTIAGINLERIKILEDLLGGQRARYEEYRKRLALAAGQNLKPYTSPEEALGPVSVSDVDAFGLLISRFFKEPASLFPALKEQAPSDEGKPSKPESEDS